MRRETAEAIKREVRSKQLEKYEIDKYKLIKTLLAAIAIMSVYYLLK